MVPEHAEIVLQAPPPPIQKIEHPALDQQGPPAPESHKIAPDELLLVGMMLYLEQGLALEWLHTNQKESKSGS